MYYSVVGDLFKELPNSHKRLYYEVRRSKLCILTVVDLNVMLRILYFLSALT